VGGDAEGMNTQQAIGTPTEIENGSLLLTSEKKWRIRKELSRHLQSDSQTVRTVEV